MARRVLLVVAVTAVVGVATAAAVPAVRREVVFRYERFRDDLTTREAQIRDALLLDDESDSPSETSAESATRDPR